MQTQKYRINQRSVLLQTNEEEKELDCSICLDVIFEPVIIDCKMHTFCQNCILNQHQCPLCRKEICEVRPNIQMSQKLQNWLCKCPLGCGQISYDELYSHQLVCQNLSKSQQIIVETLVKIKNEMIKILDKEINVHLKHDHRQIFDDFLKNWEWLPYKNEDWKWWWWSHTAWWKNKACEQCNKLWHKYEDDIQEYETLRINLLNQLQ
ncbi:unnamed protein product [Paramecium sonneborni]|uniref:RING-type domain-containing protein n=1 Tax=Paramecium sonneborni TaxID=65129 RepID=A0A8S1NNK4_9CILI|nr:unnamed protein product [Paramecium sonneborni]